MVDPYAIVRRLTGHELISPKDARLLTEAVDGLIDEIGSKDARIAKLAAENERLREQITKATDPTYLEEKLRQIGVTDEMATEALSAAARVRAEDNAGEPVAWGEDIDGKIVSVRLDKSRHCTVLLYPAPQPSGMVKALEWVASDDWEYRWIADLYAIEDQGKNWSTDRYWLYYNGQRLGKFGTFDAASSAAQADYERRILSALTAGKPHPDDEAVDRFAAAMKAKLKWEREERGRHGWNDPEVCSEKYLAQLLIEHLAKGNDGNFEDVANFCMMLHQRGAHPRVLADALTAGKPEQVPSGWKLVPEEPSDEMVEAVRKTQSEAGFSPDNSEWLRDNYSVMLSAAPAAPTAGGGDA